MIAILDYGSGNLRSAQRAFATTGHDVELTSDLDVALKADGLVVPGVGAFAACMNGINAIDAADVIRQRKSAGKYTLGICIGMQILFSDGLEHGKHKGIGMWNGEVSAIDAPILPHMGWNTIKQKIDIPLTSEIGYEDRYYFVHSYYVKVLDKASSMMTTNYGIDFDSGIINKEENIFGVQFHPEKSHKFGIKIFKNFIKI